jgi:hypothetical protein
MGWVGHIKVINEPLLLSLKDMERITVTFPEILSLIFLEVLWKTMKYLRMSRGSKLGSQQIWSIHNQMKGGEMGGACGLHGDEESAYRKT